MVADEDPVRRRCQAVISAECPRHPASMCGLLAALNVHSVSPAHHMGFGDGRADYSMRRGALQDPKHNRDRAIDMSDYRSGRLRNHHCVRSFPGHSQPNTRYDISLHTRIVLR